MESLQFILLAATFVAVAALPLAWAWTRGGETPYKKLAYTVMFLTFDLIVFGAFTRLTDSGLGCPDWPGCYAHANPFSVEHHIDAAAQLLPDGPVTRTKAWIEMTHRYFAGAIGFLCIVLAFWPARRFAETRAMPFRRGLPLAVLICVVVQGAFGALTVTQKLQPAIVTMHLLLGMSLLMLITCLATRQNRPDPLPAGTARALRPWLAFAALALLIQLALGAWVSTNYATLACTEFPTCQGAWWPKMDFEHGFTLWRALGKTAGGEFLPFAALTAIHFVHRSFAWIVAAAALAAAWKIHSAPDLPADYRRYAHGLAGLVGLQFITGLATIFLNFPLGVAVLHNAGAALLVWVLTVLNYRAVFSTKE